MLSRILSHFSLWKSLNKSKLNDIKLERDKLLNSLLNEINKTLNKFAEANKIDIIISSFKYTLEIIINTKAAYIFDNYI